MVEFTDELNASRMWYRDEIIELMKKHNVSPVFIEIFQRNEMYRWYPEEVMKVVNASYPIMHVEKIIPEFLLKKV